MEQAQSTSEPRAWLFGAGKAVAIIAVVKLLVHLYAGRHYGYFVDELYYLACSRHLAWGYVDQPPMIAGITWLIRHTLGDSLPAIHLLPALAGVIKVVLTGFLARELGGGRFAQATAALAAMLAPGFLALDNWLSMNAFEPLFWTGCACLVARMIRTGNTRLWLWFGVLAGLGLENKHSMLIFGFALVGGLVLTPLRRLLGSRYLLLGGAIAGLVFLPNLLWNVQYHFPFLELQRNISQSGRNVDLGILKFWGEEVLAMLPLSLPVWVAGLWHLLAGRTGRPFRALGWAFLIAAAVVEGMNPRIYYLFPAFPVLMAAGGVFWEARLRSPKLRWVAPVYGGLMVLMGALLAPTLIPLLPPETYIRYAAATHLQQPRVENHELGPLPQLFADQFGWEEMTAIVARKYNSLPPDVRARTAIFGQNYGQAGAIDFFGPKYGLPQAISGHQSYYLWGPRGYTGESMIVMGDREQRLRRLFDSVEYVGRADHPYSMPYEHFNIYYCQGIKTPLPEIWPKLKSWN